MGLFGGMSEDEMRVSGTAASASVVYSDDTGKRRDDGAWAKVKLQQGGMSVQHVEIDANGMVSSYTTGPQSSESADDTAARLRKVDELHAQGLIDAAERERLLRMAQDEAARANVAPPARQPE